MESYDSKEKNAHKTL